MVQVARITGANGGNCPAYWPPKYDACVANSTAYYFRTPDDYWLASGPEISSVPGYVITNLYSGSGLKVAPEFFGMHWHNTPNSRPGGVMYGNDNTLLDQDLLGFNFSLARTHDYFPNSAGSVRWHSLEPTKNSFVWENLDHFINTNYARGRKNIVTFGFTPTWATSAADAGSKYQAKASNPPDNIADWNSMVTAVVTRYIGKIFAAEVWNEPDNTSDGAGAWFNGTHAQYVALARNLRATALAIDPAIKIIGPGLAGTHTTAGRTWLDTMLNTSDGVALGSACFDAISIHSYQSLTSQASIVADIDAVRTIMTNRGIGALDLYMTEGGIGAPYITGMTPEEARKRMVRMMLVYAAKGVKSVCWYDGDGTTFGWLRSQPTAAAIEFWNDLVYALVNGEITLINHLWDGRVAYIRKGVKYII